MAKNKNKEMKEIDIDGVKYSVQLPFADFIQKLHVEFANTDTSFSNGAGGDWGSEGLLIENTSSNTNTMAMIQLRNGDADFHIAGIRQGTDDSDLGFFSEGSEKVRITHGGNVGINVIDPDEKLEVAGKTHLGGRGQDGGAYIAYATLSETQGGAATILGNAVYAGTGSNVYRKTYNDAGNFIRMTYNQGICFHTNVTGNAASTEYPIHNMSRCVLPQEAVSVLERMLRQRNTTKLYILRERILPLEQKLLTLLVGHIVNM